MERIHQFFDYLSYFKQVIKIVQNLYMSKVPLPPGRSLAPPGRKIPAPIPKAKIPPPKIKIQETPEEERPEKINNLPENEFPHKQLQENGQLLQTSKYVPSNLPQTTQRNQIQVKVKRGTEDQQINKIIVEENKAAQNVQENIQPDSNTIKKSQVPSYNQNIPKNPIPAPPIKKAGIPKSIPKAPIHKMKIPPPRNLNQPIAASPTSFQDEQLKQNQIIGQSSPGNISSPPSAPNNVSKKEEITSPIEINEQNFEKVSPVQNKMPSGNSNSQKPIQKSQKIAQTQEERVQQSSKRVQAHKSISQIKVYPSPQEKTPLKIQSSINISQKSPQKSALSKKLQQLKKATEEMLKQEQQEDNDQQQENQGSIAPSDSNFVQDVVIEASSSEKITKEQEQHVSHSSARDIQRQAKAKPIIPVPNQDVNAQKEDKQITNSVPLRVVPPPSKGSKSKWVPPQFTKNPTVAAAQIPTVENEYKVEALNEESIDKDKVSLEINSAGCQEIIVQKGEHSISEAANNSRIPSLITHSLKIETKLKVVNEQPVKKNEVINQLLQRYHSLKNGYIKNLRQLDDLIHFQKHQQQHQIQKINLLLSQLHKKNDILRKAFVNKSSPPSQELEPISI